MYVIIYIYIHKCQRIYSRSVISHPGPRTRRKANFPSWCGTLDVPVESAEELWMIIAKKNHRCEALLINTLIIPPVNFRYHRFRFR